jgi:dipeptidyl aminopeptidase/acylaminoacyl peptidase
MRKIFNIFFICLIISFSYSQKQKFTIEDLLSIRVPSQIDLSPDGRYVVFIISEVDFKRSRYLRDIYLVSSDGGDVKRLTYSEADEFSPKFSPDGKFIAFISNREVKRKKNQIWLLPLDGGEAFKLTDAPEGVLSFQWMPDGRSIIYLTKESLPEPERRKRERDKKLKFDQVVVDREKHRIEFYQIDIETKRARKIFTGDYGVREFQISPDGRLVAYTTNYTGDIDDSRKFDIWIFDIVAGSSTQITRRPGGERHIRWSPDGKLIGFIANLDTNFSYSQREIFTVNIETGEIRNLTEGFDIGIESFEFSKGEILARTASGVYTHIYAISSDGLRIKKLLGGEKVYGEFKISSSDGSIVLISEDAYHAPDIYIWRGGDGLKRLTDLNPQVKNFKFGRQEVIRWRSFDGREIEGILVKPVNFELGRRYPMLVAVHGGPFGRVRNILRQYYAYQVWANEGYIIFAPNFRGSSGYTNEFGVLNFRDLGGGDFKDIISGVDYIVHELKIADDDKLGIFGGSYGGYMTNWAISQTDKFKAAISMFGIFNLITDFSNSNIPSWEPEYLGAHYWEDLDIYLKRSPFYYVKNIRTPVLILHGDEDPNTFISNSKEMYQALKRLGRVVEFVRYPREGHGFREPNHRIDVFYRSLDWFNKYLLGIEPMGKPIARVDEWIDVGGWKVKVVKFNRNVTYSGIDTSRKFIEVDLLFKVEGRADSLELEIVDDIELVDSSGEIFKPAGIPMEVSGVRTLAIGNFVLNLSPMVSYGSLKISFDIMGSSSNEFRLRILKFPGREFILR